MRRLVLFGLLGDRSEVSDQIAFKTQNLISVIQNRLHRELVGKTSRNIIRKVHGDTLRLSQSQQSEENSNRAVSL